MTTPGFNQRDLTRELFGERPELAFLGRLGQQGGPRRMQDYYRQRAGEFLTRFQQQLSQDLLGGVALDKLPTPEDYFGGINFQQEYRSLAPQQRGQFSSQFAPRNRFLYR